ncbi:MAG: response regulator [Deltaproteobacteria bacterium]|nr:response regulator [Deltaproteobacteria bacterium]MBN2671486.1 response regulator [Deltaproteobacteria bacterium]
MSKILVIEDDNAVRLSLQMMLEDGGYAVCVAENGEDGIEKFRQEPADLVITDLFMPKKEGIETISELKRDYPNIKIIAISGGGQHIPGGFLVFAKKLGAVHTFQKPIDNEELLQVVRSLLSEPN